MIDDEFFSRTAAVIEKCESSVDDKEVDFPSILAQAEEIEILSAAAQEHLWWLNSSSDLYLDWLNIIRDKSPDTRSRVVSAFEQMIIKIGEYNTRDQMIATILISLPSIDHFIKIYQKENE